jgi:mRNA interferase MazF
VLVLSKLPGPYDDWLICMISSHLRQRIEELDEVIKEEDPIFEATGLKVTGNSNFI